MRYWSVPPMWTGHTVAILASGPSMSQEVADRVHEANIPAIAINTTFRLAPWADMLYAADTRWWEAYERDVETFEGLRVTCSPDISRRWLKVLHDTGKSGFDPDPSCIRTGGNGGYQAIHVAIHAGAHRILLCGMDMHGSHWHDRHPEPLRNAGEGIFERWLPHFNDLAEVCKARGIEVVNCNFGSALKCWPMVDLNAALEA